MNAPIRILGGGIAGLTAAINLKHVGIDVEVHEAKDFCGKATDDFQFLENWIFPTDSLEYLKKINIETKFYLKPYYSLEILSPSLKSYTAKSSTPFMYLVRRGKQNGSIDKALEKQARERGVSIIYNSHLKKSPAQIIATGGKRASFITTGVRFKSKIPDKSITLLDSTLAPKAYAYFIADNSHCEIASVVPADEKLREHEPEWYLEKIVQRFEEYLGIDVNESRLFSGFVDFHPPQTAADRYSYFVGEAAGFQDYLAGFGMMYAFRSGHLAAKATIEGLDYNNLWKSEFGQFLKIAKANREIFETFSNKDFENMVRILKGNNPFWNLLLGQKDFRIILKKVYSKPISRALLLFLYHLPFLRK